MISFALDAAITDSALCLFPLMSDMMNHGGDVTTSGSMDDPKLLPTDNVRWVAIAQHLI